MSKFYVGQKVLVMGSTWYPTGCTRALVGKVLEVKSVTEDVIMVYGENKIHRWRFNPSDLQPITETPEALTINGVEYIRKPEPVVEHEWKFGDIAVHEDYGVGMVFTKPGHENAARFAHKGDWDWVGIEDLTFLRRADLSV